MRVHVEIEVAGGAEPPAGSPVLVQILDTALQDADAVVLAEARVSWPARSVTLDYEAPARAYPIVSVHIDADRDGKVSDGDFVTTQSFPCRPETRVEVRRI